MTDPINYDDVRKTIESLYFDLNTDECFEVRTISGGLSGFYNDVDFAIDSISIFEQSSKYKHLGCPPLYLTLNPISISKIKEEYKSFEVGQSIGSYHHDQGTSKGKIFASSDRMVSRILNILIDIDSKDKPSTEDQKNQAKELVERLQRSEFKDVLPSLITMSGNGFHLITRINKSNDSAVKNGVKSFLRSLNSKYKGNEVSIDTCVYNPSRIFKIPGTLVNEKGSSAYILSTEKVTEGQKIPKFEKFLDNQLNGNLTNLTENITSLNGDRDIADQINKVNWVIAKITGEFPEEPEIGSDGEEKYTKWFIQCPNVSQHTNQICHKKDAYLFIPDSTKSLCFHCSHAHCEAVKFQEFLELNGIKNEFFESFSLKINNSESSIDDSKFEWKPIDESVFQDMGFKAMPLDIDILPKPIRKYVKQISESANIPPDYTASPLFSLIGSFIGTMLRTRVGRNNTHLETANLWCMNIGLPSVRKGAGVDPALNHINFITKQKYSEKFDEEMINYIKQKNKFISYQSRIRLTHRPKNASHEQHKIWNLEDLSPPIEPKEPLQIRPIVTDITTAMIPRLMSHNNKGFMWWCDELSGLFASFQKDHNSDLRSKLLVAFKGDTADVVLRKGEGASDDVLELCVTLGGTIQPAVIEAMIKSNCFDGFIQRFLLMTYPEHIPLSKDYIREDIGVDECLSNEIYELFEFIENLQKSNLRSFLPNCKPQMKGNLVDYNVLKNYVEYDDDALKLVYKWGTTQDFKKNSEPNPEIQSHIGKHETLFHGLCLIYYIVEEADKQINNNGVKNDQIGIHIVEDVIKMVEYYESHARKFYQCFSSNFSIKKRVVDILKKLVDPFGSKKLKGKIISIRDISNDHKTLRDKKNEIEKVMQDFVESGVAYFSEKGKKRGWVIHPDF